MPRESTLLCLPQRGMICLWRTAGDSGVAFGSTRGRVYNAPHQARVREYTPRIPRIVKKLMQLRACSISGVPQAVRDTVSGLGALYLGWPQARAGHCPYPDDSARDENAPHTAPAHGGATLPQTGSTATGTPL